MRGMNPRLLMSVVAVAGLGMAVGCASTATTEAERPKPVDEDAVERIVHLIHLMPSWPNDIYFPDPRHPEYAPPPGLSNDSQVIEAVALLVAAYDLDAVRAAFQQYWSPFEGYESEAYHPDPSCMIHAGKKLYLLTKFIFDSPEAVRRDSPERPPYDLDPLPQACIADKDMVDLRWPWSGDATGRWCLVRGGGWIGPYRLSKPLETFDFYRRAFGKRQID